MFCVRFPALRARVAMRVSGMGRATSPGPHGVAWTRRVQLEAQQPQTLCVTLIFSTGAAGAWMTASMVYVGRGL